MNSLADIFSPHDIALDIFRFVFYQLTNYIFDFRGTTIVAIFLCTFILLVFLREQIVNGGPPELFNLDPPAEAVPDVAQPEPIVNPPPPREGREQALFDFLNQMEVMDAPNNGDDVQPPPLQQPDAPVNVPVEVQPPVDGPVDAAQDGENWNNVERIVDDLTWQKLLGLDGSLVFIEHVIWMISLNVVFIILCSMFTDFFNIYIYNILLVYFPCKIGEYTLLFFGMQTKGIYFEAALNFFVGYLSMLVTVVLGHQLMKLLRIKEYAITFCLNIYIINFRAYWIMGFFRLMMKVSLLIVLEVFVFPSFCKLFL